MLFYRVVALTGLSVKRGEVAYHNSPSFIFQDAFGLEDLHDTTGIAATYPKKSGDCS